MDIRTVSDLRRFSSEKMQKVALFATERLFQDVYCFEPGQSQKAHVHEESDKIYLVLEGRGRVRIGNEEKEILPGQAVLAPAEIEHGVSNPGPERLICLVTMAPPPPHA